MLVNRSLMLPRIKSVQVHADDTVCSGVAVLGCPLPTCAM